MRMEIENFLLGKNEFFSSSNSEGFFFSYPTIPNEFSPMIDDFAKIGTFLQDEKAVKKQLEKLNFRLTEKAKELNLLDKDFELKQDLLKTKIKKGKTISYYSSKKILRLTLENELSRYGFYPHFAKALDILNPEVFRAAIEQGILIKDPNVDLTHGEFNHPIQWLLIAYQQEESAFLTHQVIDVFKALGDARYSIYRHGNEIANMWNLLVDQTDHDDSTSSRSPNSLTQLLRKSDQLNLLKNLVNSRIEKRRFNFLFFNISQQKQKAGLSYGELKEDLLLPK